MLELDERGLRKVLILANRAVRADRPPLPAHINAAMREYVAATGASRTQMRMYQIWFRTRGCTYDRAGQCSMCNYGIGPEVITERVTRAVAAQLAKVPDGASIYLSPSGSLLDEIEVAPDLRDELLRLVAARRPSLFAFETRPEMFTPAKVDHLRDMLPEATIIGQVGVESWNPKVRNLCHLKPTPQAAYEGVADLLARRGLSSIANVTLGGLGLSQQEAIDDAVFSVLGARAAGFTTQMVFPLSAKSGTLLGWAAQQGMWTPPTLWMLIHVLARVSSEGHAATERSDVSISWFDPDVDETVMQRPDGCHLCRSFVVGELQAFRADPRRVTLERALAWTGCDCPSRTDDVLTEEPDYLARLHRIARRWQETNPNPVMLPLVPLG